MSDPRRQMVEAPERNKLNTLGMYDSRILSLAFLYIKVYIIRGRRGKVVASHAAVARSSPAEVALIYTMQEALRGYCP